MSVGIQTVHTRIKQRALLILLSDHDGKSDLQLKRKKKKEGEGGRERELELENFIFQGL